MDNKNDWRINFITGIYYLYAAFFFIPSIMVIVAIFFNLRSSAATTGIYKIVDLSSICYIGIFLISTILARNVSVRSLKLYKEMIFFTFLIFIIGEFLGYKAILANETLLRDTQGRVDDPMNIIFGRGLQILSIFLLANIYFLTRPEVKEQFKALSS